VNSAARLFELARLGSIFVNMKSLLIQPRNSSEEQFGRSGLDGVTNSTFVESLISPTEFVGRSRFDDANDLLELGDRRTND
jgi:hypothetical protein